MKLTIEEARALYFAPDALREPPYKLFRFQRGAIRYYYSYEPVRKKAKKMVLKMFTSVTSFIKMTMPTSPFLIKWIAAKGEDAAKAYANMRAEYGTLMHTVFTTLLIEKKFDVGKIPELVDMTLQAALLPLSHREEWIEELEKDVLAFAQFVFDYKIKPLAIEVVLCHPRDGYAGAVDLVCEMEIPVKGDWGEVYKSGPRKGTPKETTKPVKMVCVVDYKSGKNGFYEENEVQLEGYKQLVETNFGIKVDRLFNFSPKNWRSVPDYHLKDQTASKARAKLSPLVALMKIENDRNRRPFLEIEGAIELERGTIAHNFRSVSVEEFLTGEFKGEEVQVRGPIGERVLVVRLGNVVHVSPPRQADILGEYTNREKAAFLRACKPKKKRKPAKKRTTKTKKK